MMIPDNSAEYLYVHVPFCAHICYYCDFCHVVYQEETAEKWLNAVKTQLMHTRIRHDLKTIYIGGGTPVSLSSDQLKRLLDLLQPYSSALQEYTIEINPEMLDEEKADILSRYGINRASIGLQSSDTGLLAMMGRHHTAADVEKSVEILRKHGIKNISLDIMYSLPTQTMTQLQNTLDFALSLHPTHLSLYSLTIEKNTVFAARKLQPLDEDTEADMYEFICTFLPEHGYMQYEISNFSLPGYESAHNLAYWNYDDFTGIGCGASGKEGWRRYDNTSSLSVYLQDPFAHTDTFLAKEDSMFEMVMMGMRLKKGMNLSLFQKRYHLSFDEAFGKKAEKLYQRGWIVCENGYVRAAGHAYEILNTVLEELL